MANNNPNYLNFLIVRVPADKVTAAVGGIMRADGNGATLSDEVMQPDMRAMTPKGRYDLRRYALVAPVGEGMIVEFCYMHNMGLGLSMMLPELEVLSFRSNWETKTRGCDEFKVYRGGEVVRSLDVEQGWESSRLTVFEEGPPHGTEASERPRSKRKWLDQDALLAMAERALPGCRIAMERRAFSSVTAFAAYSSQDAPRDDLSVERTRLYQAEYEAARRLGIGKDEKRRAEIQENNDWMDHVAALTAFTNAFTQAVNRARPNPEKVRKVYDKALGDPERPPGFVLSRGFLTYGLDRSGDAGAVAYLEDQARVWRSAQDLNMRIQHTIWAMPEYADHSLAGTDDIPARAVVALKTGAYSDIEEAVRHVASEVLKSEGIVFDPEGSVLSKAGFWASAAKHLASSCADFEREMNGDLTSDLKVSSITSVFPPRTH